MGFIVLNGRVFQAAAFDMDGTAIDCEPTNRQAVQEAAGSEHTIDWSECAGKRESIIHEWLRNTYPTFTSLTDTFVDSCKAGYKNAMPSLQAREGIRELLQNLTAQDIPCIVVTNTDTALAKEKLRICGLLDYFVDVIGADTLLEMGLQAKPSGDGYRLAAERLGVNEDDMLGFEDSTVGMDALADTNLYSIHITDHGTPAHPMADIVIEGQKPEQIHALIKQINDETLRVKLLPEPSCPAYT